MFALTLRYADATTTPTGRAAIMATWQVQTVDGGTTRVEGGDPQAIPDLGILAINDADGTSTMFITPLANLLYVKRVSE